MMGKRKKEERKRREEENRRFMGVSGGLARLGQFGVSVTFPMWKERGDRGLGLRGHMISVT